MFRAFHEKRKNEEGFTLIELLVVILIIAILAAIAIPIFLRQREKGWVSAMESALKNASTAAESYATGDGNGSYTGLNSTELGQEGWRYADTIENINVTLDGAGNNWCVSVEHSQLADETQEPMAISSAVTTPTPDRACGAGVMGTTTAAATG